MNPTPRKMRPHTLLTVFLTVSLCFWAGTSASALGRDPDGSRMQARKLNLPVEQTDRLAPPGDTVDWRYFRLKAAKRVSIRLTAKGPKAVRLNLVNALGRPVASAATNKTGTAALTQSLDPGLYYISVSARQSTEYTLSVR